MNLAVFVVDWVRPGDVCCRATAMSCDQLPRTLFRALHPSYAANTVDSAVLSPEGLHFGAA